MTFDYTTFQQLALDLLTEFGTLGIVTIRAENEGPSEKPWRDDDPINKVQINVRVAFVENLIERENALSGLGRKSLTAYVSAPLTNEDLSNANLLTVNSRVYQVSKVDTIKPANLAVAYKFRVEY